MARINVLLPQFGMGMTEGEIQGWKKAVGDRVEEGEILLEVEAAKSVVEIPAPVSGTLTTIKAEEGDTVEVRSILGTIET
jgi:pyruvate/2-oxoglutarate dehydrogenase complex dihydrolipoamide acyltransferase (E2) component